MSRKPKPPLPNLHIEAISTGKLVGLNDEFGGQPIPQPNAKSRKTSAELRAIAKEKRRLEQLTVLVDAGLGNKVGYARKREQVELIPEGKRKVAEFNGLAVLMDKPPKPPWRRP